MVKNKNPGKTRGARLIYNTTQSGIESAQNISVKHRRVILAPESKEVSS